MLLASITKFGGVFPFLIVIVFLNTFLVFFNNINKMKNQILTTSFTQNKWIDEGGKKSSKFSRAIHFLHLVFIYYYFWTGNLTLRWWGKEKEKNGIFWFHETSSSPSSLFFFSCLFRMIGLDMPRWFISIMNFLNYSHNAKSIAKTSLRFT